MRDTKNVFSFGLFIVILLALAFVFLNQSGTTPQAFSAREPEAIGPEAGRGGTIEELKEQEFLGLAPRARQAQTVPAEPRTAPLLRPTPRVKYPAGRSSLQNAPRYETGKYPTAYSARSGRTGAPAQKTHLAGGSDSASSAGKGGASYAPESRAQRPVFNGETNATAYEAANDAILSYMGSKKDRRKQEALRRQMDGISSAIDRAVARAMAPKSKRATMVEKYTRGGGPEAVAQQGGPFGGVLSQIESQKSSVVNGMTSNFGASAGRKAGKIMDNFRKEAATAANRKDLTRQQKGDEIRKINRKYQRQLGQLAHDETFNKMEADQRRENEAYLARLRDKFNPKTEAAARAVLDDFTAKKMALMKEGLPAAEYQEKYLKLKQESDDKVKEAVFQNNPSDPNVGRTLNEINNQAAHEQLAKQKEDVEAGKVRDERVVVSEEVKQKYKDQFAAQRKKDQKSVADAYGEDVAQQFAAIDEEYEREVLENLSSDEGRLTVNEKNQAAVEKRNKAVQQLLEKAKNNPEIKKKQAEQMEQAVKKQNETVINRMMTSEEMRQWPAEAKKSYEKQARSILDDMAKELAQASVNAKDQKSYEAESKQIQERAQQRLQQIQVSVPQGDAQ